MESHPALYLVFLHVWLCTLTYIPLLKHFLQLSKKKIFKGPKVNNYRKQQ